MPGPPAYRLLLCACAAMAMLLAWVNVARADVVWQRPVPGALFARFAYARGTPFAAGQRRGVDFAAAAGESVAAPCSGVVAYAGRVPRYGVGVSVRCGLLRATVLGLARAGVSRGSVVRAGSRLGVAGALGRVRLGARRADDPFGYVDPLRLLGDAPPGPRPLVPVRRLPPVEPLGPQVEPAPAPTGPLPVPAPSAPLRAPSAAGPLHAPTSPLSPARSPRAPLGAPGLIGRLAAPTSGLARTGPLREPAVHAPATAPGRAPLAAWLGLALLALGAPAGGLVRIRRRRRAARRVREVGAH